jgi:putative membrane protein
MNKLLLGAIVSMALVAAVRAEEKTLDDKAFVAKALAGGRAEVKLGDLAGKQAANERVKEFAARMVKDHTEANAKLEELARNQKTTVTADPKRDKEDTFAKLSKLSGNEFDRAYIKHMVEKHQKTAIMFENESKNGLDAEVKKFAEATLPTVQAHLKMAKEIGESLDTGK